MCARVHGVHVREKIDNIHKNVSNAILFTNYILKNINKCIYGAKNVYTHTDTHSRTHSYRLRMHCSEPGLANYTFSIFNMLLAGVLDYTHNCSCAFAYTSVCVEKSVLGVCVCVCTDGTEANAHCPPFIKPRKFVQIATETFS